MTAAVLQQRQPKEEGRKGGEEGFLGRIGDERKERELKREGGGKDLPQIQKPAWLNRERTVRSVSVDGGHIQRTANDRDTTTRHDPDKLFQDIGGAWKEGNHRTSRV